ncbi:hypothetical protein MNBD_GAMMA01-1387 [hydrothermal vent metagenome]|uniref:Tyr recombinase domain-containing protein n=1 Tax=hydrothermal vent metagenome TaxID=652676 RepID=A0A3B0VR99_9ZZZZ
MSESTLYTNQGKRLYLTAEERQAFYDAAKKQSREIRTFCHCLHLTGCRISEALETTIDKVDLSEQAIIFRTLKKRTKVHYRNVPVPSDYIDTLDMVHGIRESQRGSKTPKLWSWERSNAWRIIKRVMIEAGIDGTLPHATAKGLRHAYGIHAIASGVPVTELQNLLGHADLKTTSIYLNAQGAEKRALVSRMW